MNRDFGGPARVIYALLLHLFAKLGAAILDRRVECLLQIAANLLELHTFKFAEVGFGLAVDILSQLFQNSIKARIQLRQDLGDHLLVDLVIDSLVVLARCLAVELLSLSKDSGGFGFEIAARSS